MPTSARTVNAKALPGISQRQRRWSIDDSMMDRIRKSHAHARYATAFFELYSALRKCKNVVFAGVLFPFLSLLKERGRRRPSSPPQCKIILPYSTRKLLFRKAPRRDFRKYTESSSTISNLWYNGFCISMSKFSGMDIGGLYHGKPCDDDDLRPGLHPCGR